MFLWPKQDIAISVAVEDVAVAKQIAEELKTRKVSYFLFTEENNWGKPILKITLKAFGRESRYVLMITSKSFKDKYWSSIERMITEIYFERLKSKILQLRLDNTEIEGYRHVIYKSWENNPKEVADELKKIVYEDKKFRRRIVLLWLSIATILTGAVSYGIYDAQKEFSSQNGPLHSDSASIPTEAKGRALIRNEIFFMDTKRDAPGNVPPHQVLMDSFYMSKTEVTIDEYIQYCSALGKSLPPQPYGRKSGNYPVVNITWHEASDYCKWTNGRLPTEAEWEYAAGGTLGGKYSGGNNAQKVAVYNRAKPSSVASKLPNANGLYDMTGNVAEWCSNWYDSGTYKIVRGGSYTNHWVDSLRLSFRDKELPDSRKLNIGFRVVWDK